VAPTMTIQVLQLPVNHRIAVNLRDLHSAFLKAFGPHVVSELPCFYHRAQREDRGARSPINRSTQVPERGGLTSQT